METKRICYPAIIVEINQDYVTADVLVGRAELRLDFPRQILSYHKLTQVGDRFNWYQSPRQDHNIINVDCIQVVERVSDPISDDVLKGLEKLFAKAEIFGN